MKSKPRTYHPETASTHQNELFEMSVGGFVVSRRSPSKVVLTIPAQTDEVTQVQINGVEFQKRGTIKEVIRVAPVKYLIEHFKKVDALVGIGYSKKGACDTVADQHNFNHESFRHQYYIRHASKKV